MIAAIPEPTPVPSQPNTAFVAIPAAFVPVRVGQLYLADGAIANALHALTLLIARQTLSELQSLGEEIDFHVAPPLCPLLGSPYDFSHTSELIDRALASTETWIAEGGLERREIPSQLSAHKHH
jgi:hypothetical protein